MAYNTDEQEQLDAVKAWWGQYGNLIMLAAVGALIAVAAFQGWKYYRHQQSVAAVTLYGQLEQAQKTNETKTVREIARQIEDRYAFTPYAALAALAAARAAYTTGEVAEAKAQLQWVIDNGRAEEMRHVARLRLAGILLDEKRYDEALTLVAGPPESFGMLFANLRGDILAAQGKAAEARTAYQLAYDKSDPASQYRNLIQAKLDALGEAK
jgi:predicted negative regulator of RcsB-dependent stress response